MRSRNNRVYIRLNHSELNHLNQITMQSKCSREGYIRMLINGMVPRAAPSAELVESLRLLRNIANNMNQIAAVANSTGNIHEEEYKENFIQLRKVINEMMILIRQPVSMDQNTLSNNFNNTDNI